jgi:glycosyltransferase involved in cell wall biosynthesis
MLHLGEVRACRSPEETITVSKTLTDYTHLSYGKKTHYIPNGVTMPEQSIDMSLLDVFDLKKDKYFMMVSRLVRHKGAHTLIKAWKNARSERPELFKDMKLAIVGGGAFTDEYVEELKTLSDKDESIVMTGQQSGDILHELFSGMYAAIHPSVSEGLPIAILEEMSYGKCVLSSDIPENLELTELKGLNFEAGNIQDLTEKIIMMTESPELVKHVGEEAARFVNEQYNWEDIARQTTQLYKCMATKKAVPKLATIQ